MKNSNKIIISNEKDERVYEWLIKQVGKEKIEWAVNNLSGNTKPYLSNIVKKLNLSIPSAVSKTPTPKARRELRQLLDFLDKKI